MKLSKHAKKADEAVQMLREEMERFKRETLDTGQGTWTDHQNMRYELVEAVAEGVEMSERKVSELLRQIEIEMGMPGAAEAKW